MISSDIRIQGFDSRAFTNLISLFAPNVVWRRERDPSASDAPEVEEAATPKPDGMLIVVLSPKDTVRVAFHTVKGRVRDFHFEGWDKLAGVPERYGAARVMVIREGALEELTQRASERMHREDDYIAQWLQIARAVREAGESGKLAIHPRFSGIPLPSTQLIRRTVDSILPDDHSFVLAVWRGPVLWTSAILRRRGGEIDWIAGPDQLLAWTGPLGGDWRRDHRIVSDVVTKHVAPVHMGIYGELSSIRRLLRNREAGAWAKAVATRDLIVHPTPPYVAVALGADAMRRVAQKSTSLLGGLDPLGRLAPLMTYVRGRVAEVASVTQSLGFDPLKSLAQFLQRVDPIEENEFDTTDDLDEYAVEEDPSLYAVRDKPREEGSGTHEFSPMNPHELAANDGETNFDGADFGDDDGDEDDEAEGEP